MRRALRYALGVTGAISLAFLVEWPLYFLTPVFAAVFLSLPLPSPTPRQALRAVGHIAVAFALGLFFTIFLLPYPVIYVPLLGLVVFHIYYLANRGGPVWLVLMSLIAVLILPMLGMAHPALAVGFAFYFAMSSALAIVIWIFAHVLMPDAVRGDVPRPPAKRQRGYAQVAAGRALKSTIVLMPMAVMFLAWNLSDEILVLVFAGIFSLTPEVASGRASGIKSVISTLIGGAAAIVLYWLLVAVPEIVFFIPLMLLTMLLFGRGIFSGQPIAAYLGSAATAVLILLSSVMDADVSITDKLLLRVLLMTAATVYVVAALAVLDRFVFARPRRMPVAAAVDTPSAATR